MSNPDTAYQQIFSSHQEESGLLVLRPNKADKPWILLDEGLYHTAVCQSSISHIDGHLGQIFYRGTPILSFINDSDFIGVAHQLIFPNASNEVRFKSIVQSNFVLLPEVKVLLDKLPDKLHPMHYVSIGLMSLSALESKYLNERIIESRCAFLIAQLSAIACYWHQRQHHKPWLELDGTLSFAEAIAKQLGAAEHRSSELGRLCNLMLILHAEHGQNCSTLTARNVASTHADIYAAVVAGMCAFSGDLHGGASQRVAEMYDEILSSGLSVDEYVNQKIARKERIMGFGHRIYNCWDPRAKIMFDLIREDNPIYEPIKKYKRILLELIERVSNDSFFKKRNIYPNPDLLNGLFYRLLGVTPKMNTVMLSMSRIAGWLAHYVEHLSDDGPIIRPRQLLKR